MQGDENEFKALGKEVKYSYSYNYDVLESFEKKFAEQQLIQIHTDEFTTLCPVTGQPDYGKIYINYIPNKRLVESKSLKLYLFSFRSVGNFHEDVVSVILNDLVKLLDPLYLEVIGKFNARGGIGITPFANYAKADSEYVSWVKDRKFSFASQI